MRSLSFDAPGRDRRRLSNRCVDGCVDGGLLLLVADDLGSDTFAVQHGLVVWALGEVGDLVVWRVAHAGRY